MVAIQHFQIGTIDTTVFDVSTGSSVDSGGNALLVTIDPNNDIGAVSIDLNGIKYLKITGKLGTDTRFGELCGHHLISYPITEVYCELMLLSLHHRHLYITQLS